MKQFRTKKERSFYFEKLVARKSNIEFNNDGKEEQSAKTIALWKEYLSYSPGHQDRIRVEWDAYYARVKQSPIALMFAEQGEAARAEDIAKLKDLADQARRMREDGVNETLAMPKTPDPYALENSGYIREYLALEREIKELLPFV